jgi:hypothetical protein
MCLAHLKEFTEAVTNEELSGDLLSTDTASETIGLDRNPFLRRRRASPPDLSDNAPLKRFRLDDVVHGSVSPAPRQECRSGYGLIRDEVPPTGAHGVAIHRARTRLLVG